MRPTLRSHWPFLVVLFLLTLFNLWGLGEVPYHPDESTQLYMSADLDQLVSEPASLAFDPERRADPRQIYRLLDAPLTRDILGLGRTAAGIPAVPTGWDWSRSWQDNAASGALPSERLLVVGRLAVALTIPFSLVCLYICGWRMRDRWVGLISISLMGMHSLVLLHARRAMAEGALLLGVSAFMASLIVAAEQPWLVGLAMAFAFNAKQSALALLPVGLVAVAWLPPTMPHKLRRIFRNIIIYLLVFGLLTLALNPVFWKQSWSAYREAIQTRRGLLADQVAELQRLFPGQVLISPAERVTALLAHLYLAPPMFYEVGNYRAETTPAEDVYLSMPGHRLFRSPLGAGMMLALTILGLLAAGFTARQADSFQRRYILLLLLANLCLFAGLTAVIPLAWQRYTIPLVPFVCLWSGFGLSWVLKKIPLPTKSKGKAIFS